MEGAILKQVFEYIVNSASPATIAAGFTFIMAFWLSWRINKVINEALHKEEEQTERIRVCEKRTEKIINTICKTPCFRGSSANCVWLQRDDRNGGDLPEVVACPLLKERL